MKRFLKLTIVLGVICVLLWSSGALALEFLYQIGAEKYYRGNSGKIIVAERIGGILSNAPDYEWWYGCSPTSTGMIMGYYDINGYGGLCYTNLVPGGTAELSNYGNPAAIANDAIASTGHINDYWVAYGHSGDDPHPGGTHTFNCLADFMGTNQDLCGNSDGSTTFWNYTDGSPLDPQDIIDEGIDPDTSGMYGIKEYVESAGYGYDALYNQYVNPYKPAGFTWEQFKAEIDAGRPVLVHVTGHSMFAYGYSGTDTVYIHDTWDEGEHTMAWGTNYGGRTHKGMTPLTVAGGEPCGPEYDYCFKMSTYCNRIYFNVDGKIISGYDDRCGGGSEYPVAGYVSGGKLAVYGDFPESNSYGGYLIFVNIPSLCGVYINWNKDGTYANHHSICLEPCTQGEIGGEEPAAGDLDVESDLGDFEKEMESAMCLQYSIFCDKVYLNVHPVGLIFGYDDACGGTPFATIGFKFGSTFFWYSDLPEDGDYWGGYSLGTGGSGNFYYVTMSGTDTSLDFVSPFALGPCSPSSIEGKQSMSLGPSPE